MLLRKGKMIREDDPRVSQFGHPAPPWLVNYADLMTELVCFFVILYALSAALNKNLQLAKGSLVQTMAQEGISGDVKLEKDGLRISLTEQGQVAFFESGRANLSPKMTALLDKMSPTLLELVRQKHDLIVEGHTDNVPIHTAQFASNWELSTARATQVVRYLTGVKEFPPSRLAGIGFGEHRPLGPNTTPEQRAQNRRVVFFVKS